jgi:hypothetical protein
MIWFTEYERLVTSSHVIEVTNKRCVLRCAFYVYMTSTREEVLQNGKLVKITVKSAHASK